MTPPVVGRRLSVHRENIFANVIAARLFAVIQIGLGCEPVDAASAGVQLPPGEARGEKRKRFAGAHLSEINECGEILQERFQKMST